MRQSALDLLGGRHYSHGREQHKRRKSRFVGAVIAGKNPFAVDVVCARLMAMEPADIFMLRSGMERGICPKTVEEIDLLGELLDSLIVPDFLPPESKSGFLPGSPNSYAHWLPKSPPPFPKFGNGIASAVGNVRKVARSIPLLFCSEKQKLPTRSVSVVIAATKCVRQKPLISNGFPCLICKQIHWGSSTGSPLFYEEATLVKQITLRGYAKINLTLDVTGRRNDGYHLLEMVMQSISTGRYDPDSNDNRAWHPGYLQSLGDSL